MGELTRFQRLSIGVVAVARGRNPFKAIALKGLMKPDLPLDVRMRYLSRVTTLEKLFERLENETGPACQVALARDIVLVWAHSCQRLEDKLMTRESAIAAHAVVESGNRFIEKTARRTGELLVCPGLGIEAKRIIAVILNPYPQTREALGLAQL